MGPKIDNPRQLSQTAKFKKSLKHKTHNRLKNNNQIQQTKVKSNKSLRSFQENVDEHTLLNAPHVSEIRVPSFCRQKNKHVKLKQLKTLKCKRILLVYIQFGFIVTRGLFKNVFKLQPRLCTKYIH